MTLLKVGHEHCALDKTVVAWSTYLLNVLIDSVNCISLANTLFA
jgi:hypothetical protein